MTPNQAYQPLVHDNRDQSCVGKARLALPAPMIYARLVATVLSFYGNGIARGVIG